VPKFHELLNVKPQRNNHLPEQRLLSRRLLKHLAKAKQKYDVLVSSQ